MNNLRQAAQQALEALTLLQGDIEWTSKSPTLKFVNSTVAALRQALAEPEQEPVAWQWLDTANYRKKLPADAVPEHWRPLYTAPTPQPEQKGWFTVKELNEWATKLPQTTHWEGCEAVHPECRKPEQEPVAWNVINPAGEIVATEKDAIHGWARLGGFKPTLEGLLGFHDEGWRVVPSTAPTPRRPLTDEEIVDIWAGVSMGYDDEINIIELARALERAHGIGEQHE